MLNMKRNHINDLFAFATLLVGGVVLGLYTSLRQDNSFSSFFVKNKISTSRESRVNNIQKYSAEFISSDNYLGIIYIDFRNNPLVEGEVTFKIKESDSKSWIFSGIFNSAQFYSLPNYPFGFPIQTNSKNKKYTFEITKTRGKDSLILSSLSNVVTSHQYPSSILKSDLRMLVSVIEKKIIFHLGDFRFYLILMYFQIPLIIYQLTKFKTLHIFGIKLKKISKMEILITIYLLLDVFIVSKYLGKLEPLFIILLIVDDWIKNRKGSLFYLYAFALFLNIPILYFLNCIDPAIKISIYTFYLFCLAGISELIQITKLCIKNKSNMNMPI